MRRSEDWLQEARLRLDDTRAFVERGRYARSVLAAYYACHAAAKGLLLAEGVHVHSHAGLRNRLGYHFVRTGVLPPAATRQLAELEQARLDADYELAAFNRREAESLLDTARRFLEVMENAT